MGKQLSHSKFLIKIKNLSKSYYNDINFVEEYKAMNEPILAIYKYGLIRIIPRKLLLKLKNNNEFTSTIMSAINKTTYCLSYMKDIRNDSCLYYDYSKFIYNGSTKKSIFICPIHGEFLSTPTIHYGNGGCPKCKYEVMAGENNPYYNHDKTDEERRNYRKCIGYKKWKKLVYEKYNYTCEICGNSYKASLNAHHKDGYNWCKERRIDLTNGVILCDNCHNGFHKIYGYGNNTEKQWEEYKIAINKLAVL